jgi:hypothetical protein
VFPKIDENADDAVEARPVSDDPNKAEIDFTAEVRPDLISALAAFTNAVSVLAKVAEGEVDRSDVRDGVFANDEVDVVVVLVDLFSVDKPAFKRPLVTVEESKNAIIYLLLLNVRTKMHSGQK